MLPRQYVELLEKTSRPFAQAVTDALAPERSFFGGKVLLVVEAAMGPRYAPILSIFKSPWIQAYQSRRPHIAASTSQSVYHALRLKDLVQGKITSEMWNEETVRFSRLLYEAAVELGHICQSSEMKQDKKISEVRPEDHEAVRRDGPRLRSLNSDSQSLRLFLDL